MKLGKPRKTKLSHCLACGHPLNGASRVDGDNDPIPGSISICIRCANIAVFDDDLNLRHLTQEEKYAFENAPEIVAVQNTILKIQKQIGGKPH